MIIEWPVALLFLIFAGLCSAYSFERGSRDLKREYLEKGAENVILLLVENDIIDFTDDGTFIGKNGKKYNPLRD